MIIRVKQKREIEDGIQSQFDFEYSEEDIEELPEFGKKSYWDNRYKSSNENFDWYFDWWRVSPLLEKYTNGKKNSALVLGCGNSTMSRDMIKDGFQMVYNIDISSVVIEQMSQLYKDEPKLIWEKMNCAKLSYKDNSFDLIFDKGTLDAIICHPNDFQRMEDTLKEVHRTLKPGGRFISITFGSPSRRLPFYTLVKLDWTLLPPFQMKHEDYDVRDIHHFVYVFEKNSC